MNEIIDAQGDSIMQHNVLITSAGKRVELLLEFRKALIRFGGRVMAADMNPIMSAACRMADKAFKVPPAKDTMYVDTLLQICLNNNVRIVIPTIDTELIPLSTHRELFRSNGIEVLVSDEDFIYRCRDKRKTMQLFETLSIRNPRLRNVSKPEFPMFAKPYDGSLSTNIHIIHAPEELTPVIKNDSKLLFMEYIDRSEYKEFTVDMYYGADGLVKSIVPRERIEIRSGEVNKGATRNNYLVNYLKERMGTMPGVRGCICVQLFYREEDNDVVGIEINPRFGGGYSLTYHAGADYPEMIVDEYIYGHTLDYSESWKDNTVMLRYDSQVIFQERDF